MTLSGHPCALTTFLLNNESIIPVQTVKYAVSCSLKIGKAVSVVQEFLQLPVFRFYVAVVNPGTIYLNKSFLFLYFFIFLFCYFSNSDF